MFDMVTRKKLYNEGTGSFKYVRFNGIPSDYTPIEYIEGTGTQYINTLYKPNNETGMKIVYQGTAWENTWIAATYDKDIITRFYLPRWASTGYKIWGWGVMGYFNFNIDGEEMALDRWISSLNFKNDRLAIVEDLTTGFRNQASLSTTGEPKGTGTISQMSTDIHILARYDNNNVVEKASAKFYSGQITQGDEIVHNFMPVLDSTGTPCLYDTITQQPFYNAGTGDFLYPSPTSAVTYSMRRLQAEYAKMTDTGIRRLYHTPIDYDGSIEDYAIENGYKRLIETESPNEEGKYYSFKWVETNDALTTEWFEIDPPQEEFFEENS